MIKSPEKKQIVINDICIKCTGLRLGSSALEFAAAQINQLQEYCPSDAFIELEVNKSKSLYGIHLVVRTHCNEICADCNGQSLAEALEGSLSKLHAQLREWRKERFACPTIHGTSEKLKGGLL